MTGAESPRPPGPSDHLLDALAAFRPKVAANFRAAAITQLLAEALDRQIAHDGIAAVLIDPSTGERALAYVLPHRTPAGQR